MRLLRTLRLYPLLLLIMFAQACSTVRTVGEDAAVRVERYETRAEILGSLDNWVLKGRLAVSDDNDGGSGNLHWQQRSGESRMDFHGAMGRGAWRLAASDGLAELELADGSRYRAETIGELVRGQLGWEIPVEALSWWVRGLEAPGDFENRVLEEDGTLGLLSQQGWEIEYGRYREVGAFTLPLKLTARQADKTVKLAIRDWEIGAEND